MAEFKDKTADPPPETGPKGDGLEGDWKDLWVALLPKPDLASVSNTCPNPEEIITQYHKSGENLRIDDNFLLTFPTKMYKKMYKRLGRTVTSLTLSSISEDKSETLFAYFKNLRYLSLENMEVLTMDRDEWPVDLKCLRIVECKMDPEFLAEWFLSLNRTLTSLHMDNIVYEFMQSPSICRNTKPLTKFLSCLSNLQEMELLNMDCRDIQALLLANSKALKSLNVKGLKVCKTAAALLGTYTRLHSLEYLCMESLPDPSYLEVIVQQIAKIQSPPVDYFRSKSKYRPLKLFKGPTHLRISRGVDIVDKEELEKLQLEKLDFGWCYDPPVEPNAILQLNDDCILEIMSCSVLSTKDLQSFGETHPRFRGLAMHRKRIVIDGEFLQTFPLNGRRHKDMYETMGQRADHVTLLAAEGLDALPFFTSAKSVMLANLEFVNDSKADFFPLGVEILHILKCNFQSRFLQKLCRRLSGWLTEFIYGDCGLDCDLYPALNELTGIRVLHIRDCITNITRMGPFFSNNRDHLETLVLEVNLWDLSANDLTMLNDLPVLNFLMLSVQLPANSQLFDLMAFASKVGLAHLKELSVIGFGYCFFDFKKLADLKCIKNLTTFEINLALRNDGLFQLIEKMPKLINLHVPVTDISQPFQFEYELKKYLQREKRTLFINRVKIFLIKGDPLNI